MYQPYLEYTEAYMTQEERLQLQLEASLQPLPLQRAQTHWSQDLKHIDTDCVGFSELLGGEGLGEGKIKIKRAKKQIYQFTNIIEKNRNKFFFLNVVKSAWTKRIITKIRLAKYITKTC